MKNLQVFRRSLLNSQRTFTTTTRRVATPICTPSHRISKFNCHESPFPAFRPRRPYSNGQKPSYNPTPHLNSPQPSLSLSQRLRKLSREYGWSAFGVYMLLSALDFPFCFAAVRYLGTERIGHYEHVVFGFIKSLIPESVIERWHTFREKTAEASPVASNGETGNVTVGGISGEEKKVEAYGVVAGEQAVGVMAGYDHGVKEAEKLNESEDASIWTQLALAYAIHKTFIFIRVPLTVAVTPKVVKVLRGWGWDIGKRKPKIQKGA